MKMAAKKAKKETGAKKEIEKGVYSLRLAKARNGKDFNKVLNLAEAVKLIKSTATAKFDEGIDLALNMGIDVTQSDQNIRGVVSLPNGTGKKLTIAVFARDKKADEAKKAGAQIVGAEDLIEKVSKGKIEFDKCIATPDMMPLLSKVAKILGPKGLMPNPKLGSVSEDVTTAVKNALAGQVEFRADKAGVVQTTVGKASFDDEKLVQNIKAFMDALGKAKPAGFKGIYIKKMYMTSTMGPSVRVNISSTN
jgi:large subunit ribosomal protein L1